MTCLLEMNNICKTYDNGVRANDGVNLSLEEKEIHAIAGENGAGKSTVMKILYGLEKRDSGTILFRGQKAEINSPRDAMKLGIGMVQQHFMLVPQLPVYQNIFLGQEIQSHGFLSRKEMVEKTIQLGEKYGMPIDPCAKCGDLTVGMAQRVEILKLLARETKLLILDEPTAVLTPQETEELFVQLRLLRESGHTCVIITHKLKEIVDLCDRITIMRDGKTMGVHKISEVDEQEISRLMTGRNVQLTLQKKPAEIGEEILKIEDLTVRSPDKKILVDHVNLSAHAGEIVCFAGVEGNGQHEVVQCITGLDSRYTGKITMDGKDIRRLSIKKNRGLGIGHIPEDRMTLGINKQASILENLISVDYEKGTHAGFIPYHRRQLKAQEQIQHYQVKCGSARQNIGMLSGGNIQKVVAAREMDQNPRLLVADQPTRGIDVGAMEMIHTRLVELRDAGCAVLLVSADMSEVFNLADRILVFHEGKITAEITDIKHLTEEQLGRYMLGLDKTEVGAADEN